MAKVHIDPKTDAQITQLLLQKIKYEKKLLLINISLHQIALQAKGSINHTADDPDNEELETEKPLELIVHKLLLNNSMSLKDLVVEILHSGYKSKAKNFSVIVQQVIQRLVKVDAVKQDEKDRKYSGVAVAEETLRQSLSRIVTNKRQARTPKG